LAGQVARCEQEAQAVLGAVRIGRAAQAAQAG
jgi:hypothetical protein